MSKHLYVGPYLEARVVMRPEPVVIRACPNTACKKYPKDQWGKLGANFCPECGTAAGHVTVTVEYSTDRYDVVGDDLTEVCTDRSVAQVVFLAPNQGKGPTRDLFVDDEFHVNVEEFDIHAEMAWFETEYAVAIAKVREAYADVQVRWGIHQFFI